MASGFMPPEENALTINSIGMPDDLTDASSPRGPQRFPAWIARSEVDAITKLQLGAVRLEHIADLAFIQPRVFVFDVGHVSGSQREDGSWDSISLGTAASNAGAQLKGGDDDNILLTSDGFRTMLSEFGHYQLSALGLQQPVDDLADLWVRANRPTADDDPVLAAIDEADAYVAIHDDCYATVELRSSKVADALAARMLWIALSTAARASGLDIPTEAPPANVIDACLGESGLFFSSMHLAEAPTGCIDLLFSHSTFAIGDEAAATKLVRWTGDGWSVHPLEEEPAPDGRR